MRRTHPAVNLPGRSGVCLGVKAQVRQRRTSGEVGMSERPAESPLHAVPSFDAVFVEEYPKMVALAAAVSGSRSSAEDIAQEAMARLDRNWAKVQGYDNPGGWLRRVTVNLAVSRRRRLVSEAKALLRLDRPASALPPEEPADPALWAAVAALPRNQRAAIALHYLEDRSVADIADVLDISPSTAKVHLHRGRQALRTRLEQEDRP